MLYVMRQAAQRYDSVQDSVIINGKDGVIGSNPISGSKQKAHCKAVLQGFFCFMGCVFTSQNGHLLHFYCIRILYCLILAQMLVQRVYCFLLFLL